ncbi:hypothetical protein HK101_008033 [Irineochytrium annulatum]|nr:hypothetical protein HK101_008033 [Irineochytrium annulatum]
MVELSDLTVIAPSLSIAAYFSVLAFTLALAFSRGFKSAVTFSRILYLLCACASFYVTWGYIFAWLRSGYDEALAKPGGSLTTWIVESDLFDAAYAAVSEDRRNWWWSVQLLNFTCTLIVFMWTEGAHHVVLADRGPDAPKVKGRGAWFISPLVYTVLGFIGAISVAFPLFLIQRSLVTVSSPYTLERPARPTTLLTLMMVLSIASNTLTPFIAKDSSYFGYNLKALHFFLLLPIILVAGRTLIFWPAQSERRRRVVSGIGVAPLYGFLAGGSIVSHLNLSLDYFVRSNGTAADLMAAIFSNPCQTSITSDLGFTTLVASVFMLREAVVGPVSGRVVATFAAAVLVLLSPFLSISGGVASFGVAAAAEEED